jgi:hypothetical protein
LQGEGKKENRICVRGADNGVNVKGVIDLAKAILEQFEPKNCFECILSFKRDNKWFCAGFCHKQLVNIDPEISHRPSFCPLKIIDD